MYVNIKTQKDSLNMNPACSANLGVYEWRRRGFVYYTNTEWSTRELAVIFGLCISLHEHMNLQDSQSHFMRILPFRLRKLASYHTVSGLAKSLARRPGLLCFPVGLPKCITALPDGLPPRGFLKTPKVSCIKLKENATVFPYSNMFFPQLRRVDMYLSRLSPCT